MSMEIMNHWIDDRCETCTAKWSLELCKTLRKNKTCPLTKIVETKMKDMKCPNPKCDEKKMKCIVNEPLTRARVEKRFICKCGAFVKAEYDLYEE